MIEIDELTKKKYDQTHKIIIKIKMVGSNHFVQVGWSMYTCCKNKEREPSGRWKGHGERSNS